MAEQQKESTGPTGSESDTGDGEFEPTAEMLVDDFDDERTLDEEEDMEEGSDREEEIDTLQKVGGVANLQKDMPIEQLLAMYGGYPPEEGEEVEAETEEQANGEGEAIQAENENENSNEVEIENVVEAENEVEEQEEPEVISSRSSTSEENVNNHDKEVKPEVKPERKRREKTSELAQLYADMDTNGDTPTTSSSRSLRCHKPVGILSTVGSRQQSEDEEEEEGEYSGEEEDWHKTIMIGASYQAQVPEGLQAYGATPPYENEDKLLWEPGKLSPKQVHDGEQLFLDDESRLVCSQVEEYLRALSHPPPGSQGVAAIPLGKHVRDDEQALYLLLQCGYNVEEALRRHRMNPTPLASTMTLWSEEECRNFENGLKTYGKDFHLIQQNKVRTRSVGELVQFYYLWKKTERHDLFATKTRIEKKKYIVHPGTTDYMDRFLDEGEGGGVPASWRDNRSSSPSLHALLYGKPPPGSNAASVGAGGGNSVASAPAAQPTPPTSTAEANLSNSSTTTKKDGEPAVIYQLNQMEDLARHLDSDSLESLAKMTSSNASVSIAKSGKRTSSPRPMDVDLSISRTSVLNSQPISAEAKNIAKAETVAQ
ncbi:mesoderm induction early response protein 1-like isoform X3 [Penaeus indicus]|uniref:mesoderm induction early response protein 1-like isoform X3 n=1 Tax=Penaeus indicus TaxID=29960 RepID=UPI00300D7731